MKRDNGLEEDVLEEDVLETTPPSPEDDKSEDKTDNETEKMLLEELNKLQKRLDDQSRIIGKLTNANKNPEKVEDEPKTKKESEISKFHALEEKIKALEEKNLKKLDAVKRSKLASSIISNGGDSDLANEYAEFLSYKLGEKLVAEENDIGDILVKVIEKEEEPVEVDNWVKMFMASDAGRILNPKIHGASVRNNGRPPKTTTKTELSAMDYSKTVATINADRSLTKEQKEQKISQFKMIN